MNVRPATLRGRLTALAARLPEAREPRHVRITARMIAVGLLAGAALAALAIALLDLLPTFDTAYHLVWAHEVLDGRTPSFDAASAPTEHPFLMLVAAAVAPLGAAAASKAVVVPALLGAALAVGALMVLGRQLVGWIAAAVAAVFAVVYSGVADIAIDGYVDACFVGVILLAIAAEVGPRRRPTLAAAAIGVGGLIRPEGWALGCAWLAWRALADEGIRPVHVALVAAGPVGWALVDLLGTGDPTFSFTHTHGRASELDRDFGLVAALKGVARAALREDFAPFWLAQATLPFVALVAMPRRMALLLLGTLVIVGGAFLGLTALGLVPSPRYLRTFGVIWQALTCWGGVVAIAHVTAGRPALRPVLPAAAAAFVLVLATVTLVDQLETLRDRSEARADNAVVSDVPAGQCPTIWAESYHQDPFVRLELRDWAARRLATTPQDADCLLLLGESAAPEFSGALAPPSERVDGARQAKPLAVRGDFALVQPDGR